MTKKHLAIIALILGAGSVVTFNELAQDSVVEKFDEIAPVQSVTFTDWFEDKEAKFDVASSGLHAYVTEKDTTTEELFSKHGVTEITPGEMYAYLKNEATEEAWMVFYMRDSEDIRRAVYVRKIVDGWELNAVPDDHKNIVDGREYLGWREGVKILTK